MNEEAAIAERVAAKRSKIAYVVGGGIAGLTAAHELVERGFEVHVFERLAAPFDASDCTVGGMARTQWCSATAAGEPALARAASLMGDDPGLGECIGGDIRFPLNSATLDGVEMIAEMAKKMCDHVGRWLRGRPASKVRIYVQGYAVVGEKLPERSDPTSLIGSDNAALPANLRENLKAWLLGAKGDHERTLSRARALAVVAAMIKARPDLGEYFELQPTGLGGVPRSYLHEPEQDSVVRLRLADMIMPGEHGYRYFPAFYRHVMDTMKRIPLFESAVPPRPRERREVLELAAYEDGEVANPDVALGELVEKSNLAEAPRTVLDNLVSIPQCAIVLGNDKPAVPIPRTQPKSLVAFSKLVNELFRELEVEPTDSFRLQLALAVFLTSSSQRRKDYEEQTWAKFIKAEKCSPQFQDLIERWPQALVGLRASLADARTIGDITIQLLLKQSTLPNYTDGILNGPTTKAWLDPWRRYLEARGVTFRREKVKKLVDEKGLAFGRERDASGELVEGGKLLAPGYVVLAVSPLEAQRLVLDLEKRGAKVPLPRSIEKLKDWPLAEGTAGEHPGSWPIDPNQTDDKKALHTYAGIQFYLADDLGPAQGYLYIAKSEWRLSAISQVQYWQQRLVDGGATASGRRYFSILSVDIGDWYSARKHGKAAVDCSRSEFAQEVWDQLSSNLQYTGGGATWAPPVPFAFHIDDDIKFEGPEKKERPVSNASPYPVNLAREWHRRPGSTHTDYYELADLGGGNKLAIAGAYVKTKTRLATMESANESARRAVNAILLDQAGVDLGAGPKAGVDPHDLRRLKWPNLCQLWDPEDNEIDDLDFLKEVDEALYAEGLPHMLEILGIEALIDNPTGLLSPATLAESVLKSAALARPLLASVGAPVQLIEKLVASLLA